MKQDPTGQAHQALRPDDMVQGFPCGSTILTLDGAMPVEFLSPGDRIITRDRGMAILRDLESLDVTCDTVAVMAGTLGADRPDTDVILPADQAVLLRDWRAKALFGRDQALAPVRRLVDGEFIRHAGKRPMRLIRLGFDAPHILYVDGMELACAPALPLRRAA